MDTIVTISANEKNILWRWYFMEIGILGLWILRLHLQILFHRSFYTLFKDQVIFGN